MTQVKYPEAYAQLTGEDGNEFNIIATVRRAIKDAEYGYEAALTFAEEAMRTESYGDLLRLCGETVNVH